MSRKVSVEASGSNNQPIVIIQAREKSSETQQQQMNIQRMTIKPDWRNMMEAKKNIRFGLWRPKFREKNLGEKIEKS
ncbi:1082_t:CDS:2 [Diversispora eburnea]|uniref:1082_t:CDS:1 n=1 Tax=Diversispora eburnea TaxID=1213867 RepID=A0A9N8ZZW3_9GLOM|nr:1082_t:CDS:2 [Diversispora eburnea]